MEPSFITDSWSQGAAADVAQLEARAQVGRYCLQDTLLPLRLMAHLNVAIGMMQMAAATSVPLDYLLLRGQSIKSFSYIVKRAGEQGYVVPTF